MNSVRHLRTLRSEAERDPVLTLADFPLGSFGGASIRGYRAPRGRLHLDRDCPALSRSSRVSEETLVLPATGSLAELQSLEVHCSPPGVLRAYLSKALRMCAASEKLLSIAERLGIQYSTLRLPVSNSHYSGRDVDWQAILEARTVRDELDEVSRGPSGHTATALEAEYSALTQGAIGEIVVQATALYQRALELATVRQVGRPSGVSLQCIASSRDRRRGAIRRFTRSSGIL